MDLTDLILATVATLAAVPAAYFTARRTVLAGLTSRLNAISGGRVASLEALVAAATAEARLREQPIAVYGQAKTTSAIYERTWADLRKSFPGALLSYDPTAGHVALPGADVVVIAIEETGPEVPAEVAAVIASRPERVVLIYKQGAPYRGTMPPGIATFANSPLTLEARLMEALRYLSVKKPD